MKKVFWQALAILSCAFAFTNAHAQFTVIRGINPSNAFVNLNSDGSGNLAVNCVTGCAASAGTGGLAANGAAPSGNPVWIAGYDGTLIRALKTDTSGQLNTNIVNSPSVLAFGTDGTNTHNLLTDTSGNLIVSKINGALPSGANTIGAVTISGTPSVSITGTPTVSVTSISAGTNNIGKVSPQPTTATATDCSSTITTGGTSQTAIASNASRHSFYIQNTSTANEAINFTSAASLTSGSFILPPNAMYQMESSGYVASDAITIIGATTGQAFACKWF